LLSASAQVTNEDLDLKIKPFKEKIKSLESENSNLKSELNRINSNVNGVKLKLNSLELQVKNNSLEIQNTNTDLSGKISSSETTTNHRFTQVDHSISKNSLWSIIGVLATIIISGLVYLLLSKRQTTDKTDLIDKLSKTKSSIEETLVSEFSKQSELIEKQIELIEEQNRAIPSLVRESDIDHSLALKVADEITLIERNISLMDPSVKGLKQLARSVVKLKDNLLANGYELPELLGKNFHQGMKVIISSSMPDDNLDKGVEIITRIIKPQVNYKDVMIQTAQIETSKGI
jgi:predicted nuclease with TOPRIM domain